MRLRELVVRVGSTSFVQSSALAVALLGARMLWTREPVYGFLLWNLFLAWVPWGMALVVRVLHERRAHPGLLSLAFAAWLGFLPNAPYIVTDFIHLRFRDGAPLWFDAVMLASYAWAGVGLGVASLRICAQVVRARRGPWISALFVAASGLATGYGIYLGRFIRLNTWDVLSKPLSVIQTAFTPVVHPMSHFHAWVATFAFGLFFLAAYGTGLSGTTVSAGALVESRAARDDLHRGGHDSSRWAKRNRGSG